MDSIEQYKTWSSVSLALLKNPYNLSLWQDLIHCAEHQNGSIDKTSNSSQVSLLRQSYEALLNKYPLLLNYRISFATWEKCLNNFKECHLLFSQGLDWGCHDVQFWVSYLNVTMELSPHDLTTLLELFEIARYNIGFNYYSYEFYSLYLNFLRGYATIENKFNEKSIVLLRTILEIPLYNYAAIHKEASDILVSPNVTINDLSHFFDEVNFRELKKSAANRKNVITRQVSSVLTDLYVVSQYNSYQLFQFERDLCGVSLRYDLCSISSDKLDVWNNYLNYVEQLYPHCFVVQLYERALLASNYNMKIVSKYFEYLCLSGHFNKAKNVIRKSISLGQYCSDTFMVSRLIDLEFKCGNILCARDLICRYLMLNKNVPNHILEKLLQIERFTSSNDEEYINILSQKISVISKHG